jgi:hypothetical protein
LLKTMGSLREAIKFPLRNLNRSHCALAREKPSMVDVELRSIEWLMPSQVAQVHGRLLEGLVHFLLHLRLYRRVHAFL